MYRRLIFLDFKLTIVLTTIGLTIFLTSCFSNNDSTTVERFEIQTVAKKEVQIPKILMAELEAEITREMQALAPVYLFMPIEIQFVELNDSVLKRPNMLFSLPKGGGHIDLKDVVTGFGSFYLRFPPAQFENISELKPALLHLYYISNSPIKKIDDELFGLGCGKMIDLKKNFDNLQNPNFLKLNTSDLRYLYVTAGRYVFIFKQWNKIYLTQITITDSRHSKELCLGADF